MARRIRPGGLALIVSGCRVDTLDQDPWRDDLLGAWQQYGELHGMPTARMAAIIDELLARQCHLRLDRPLTPRYSPGTAPVHADGLRRDYGAISGA